MSVAQPHVPPLRHREHAGERDAQELRHAVARERMPKLDSGPRARVVRLEDIDVREGQQGEQPHGDGRGDRDRVEPKASVREEGEEERVADPGGEHRDRNVGEHDVLAAAGRGRSAAEQRLGRA